MAYRWSWAKRAVLTHVGSQSSAAYSLWKGTLHCPSAPTPPVTPPKPTASQIPARHPKGLYVQLPFLSPCGASGGEKTNTHWQTALLLDRSPMVIPRLELGGDVVKEALCFIVEALRPKQILFNCALVLRLFPLFITFLWGHFRLWQSKDTSN